jgi:hypothetical protein
MQHHSLARVAASIAAGFATLALSATVAAAQGSTTPPPQKSAAGSVEQSSACTIKLAVDSVPTSPTPVVLNATLSTAIGDSVSASLPSESSASVESVEPAAAGGANALQLKLNTSAAKPGEWPLAVKGKTGECTGKLKIVGGSR